MKERPVEILLVESDIDLAEMIVRCLEDAIVGNVTHVLTADAAMREELTTRHGLIMLATDLPDGDGIETLRQIRVTNRAPAILMADELSTAMAVEAIRLGVRDVHSKPFDLAELTESAREIAERVVRRRHQIRRYRRLRRLTAKIVRERRDLRQRMDLICRDFVYAYRRLAQRVADSNLLTQK